MIDCPECNGTGTETRERYLAGKIVEYYITCNNCTGKKQIEPMPEETTMDNVEKHPRVQIAELRGSLTTLIRFAELLPEDDTIVMCNLKYAAQLIKEKFLKEAS
tara:strand:+ start:560 stop:871 length:312 start_codon:yes stop_codon:yes gene_type:complete